MNKFKKLFKKLRGRFSTPLPVGMKEFDAFCTDLFQTYDLPDLPSYRQAVASGVMHLGPTVDRRCKSYFAKTIKKAMANQIAYENIQLLKQQEAAYIAATIASQNTPSDPVASTAAGTASPVDPVDEKTSA